jgi:glycogen operon protein
LLGNQLLLHVMMNAYWDALDFELPPTDDADDPWRRCVDTSLESPDDARPWREAPVVRSATYRVGPRSIVVLVAGTRAEAAPGRRVAMPGNAQ